MKIDFHESVPVPGPRGDGTARPSRHLGTSSLYRLSGGQQEQESAGFFATKPIGRVPFGVTRLPPLRFFSLGIPERYWRSRSCSVAMKKLRVFCRATQLDGIGLRVEQVKGEQKKPCPTQSSENIDAGCDTHGRGRWNSEDQPLRQWNSAKGQWPSSASNFSSSIRSRQSQPTLERARIQRALAV